MTSTHESTMIEITETHKTEVQTLKLKITELTSIISQLEDDNDGHLRKHSRLSNEHDDLQNEHDALQEHNNKLKM